MNESLSDESTAIGGCAVVQRSEQLAMHRALGIPEIVATICENFVQNDNEFDPGLVRVASGAFGLAFGLASKSHLEPCLDALWKTTSFAHLVKSLPDHAWHQNINRPRTLSFLRGLGASDWQRFDFYAKRVRHLVLCDLPPLAPSIFRTIESSLRPLPLLPNLIYLVCNHLAFDIAPFLGSKLSRISITTNSTYIPSVVKFKTLTPLLNNIEFTDCPWPAKKLSPAIIDLVHSLQTLHCLKLIGTFVTADCLAHLSGLPHLRTLYITLDTSHGHTQPRSLLHDSSFPALRELGLCVDSWTIAIDSFATAQTLRPLQIIEVKVGNVPSQQELTRFLDTILNCCLPSSLRQLVLRPDDIADEKPSCVLDPLAIRRFFAFANLEVLCISIAVSFDEIDDTLIRDMAWSKVTVYGLLPLANCPLLTSLTIYVNATIPPSNVILRPDGGFYNGALLYLAVGYSPIGDSVAVASFLSNIFPNLKDIEAWDSIHGFDPYPLEEGSAPMLWEQMLSFYQPFVGIRRQEGDLAVRT
ncbi:hypothetical protein PILCRDRAFT_15175 [Piloderma croceum F 1598]|uniref:F-box domain-containing protein n=1 Tax=Piloderma croceum (strain F 1598) TaxID=765440 RepID=A0A0C3F0M7_PILCF|nr:hypothetical protein PILCRDRAFT_15175 [Piloderma croceum F 1598]